MLSAVTWLAVVENSAADDVKAAGPPTVVDDGCKLNAVVESLND
jgi:hypothetical protein